MTQCKASKRGGFSLVELMVVVVIGGTMLGLILPAIYAAQGAAGNRKTENQLKQFGLAIHNCQDVYNKLPPAFDEFGVVKFPASIQVHLMPFLDEDKLYKEFLQKEGKGEAANFKVPTFLAEDDPSSGKHDLKGVVNFAANLRVFSDKGLSSKYNENMKAPDAVEPGTAKMPRSFRDGTSNTIIFSTKYGYCGKGGSKYASAPNTAFAPLFGQNAALVKAHPSDKTATFQLRPGKKDCCTSPLMAQSFTKESLQVGLGDGSVRTVTTKLTPETWNRALHPSDGLPLGPDW